MSAKIIPFGGVTKLDLPADRVLESAKEHIKGGVLVLGYDNDDDFYFASSLADGGEVLWLMEIAKKRLLNIGDEE